MGERQLQESHFIELPEPCHVYSLARIRHEGRLKALVASHRRLYCAHIEASLTGAVEWRTLPLPLVPEGADVVSVDAFNQISKGNPPVVGITLLAPTLAADMAAQQQQQAAPSLPLPSTTGPPSAVPLEIEPQSAKPEMTYYLYIYGAQCTESDAWDRIAANRQIIKLDYVPFIISHQEMEFPGGVASVFLVSGSDNRIHLYKFVPESGFHELLGSKYLPTMTTSYPSSVISLDTEVFGAMGVLAVGCQDGTVQVISKQDGVTRQWSVSLDGPISSLKLYKSDKKSISRLKDSSRRSLSEHPLIRGLQERIAASSPTLGQPVSASDTSAGFEVNLIVGASIGYAIVFKNILELGFSDFHFLPESDKNDAVLAVGLADADFDHDGHTEILVGTYGRKLLVYKETGRPQEQKGLEVSESPLELTDQDAGWSIVSVGMDDTTDIHAQSPLGELPAPSYMLESAYKLVWQRQFVYPILDFLSDDWTGDGINDLVVCSKFGLHLMQSELSKVKDKALRRLRMVSDILALEAEITQLEVE